MERGREVGRESTEEVEGRLASIRERDADRVGESWVRSHKEVDTRRHLNPPCPPSRTSSPELRPYSSAQSPRRLPIANHRSRPPSPCLSLIVLSLCFAHSRSVRLAPGIYCASFSLSLPPSVAILSLYWRSLRASLPTPAKGNPPQKQKREAKAARGSSRVVGGFFCYCRQMLYLVKRGEERRGGEIEGERKKVVSGGVVVGGGRGQVGSEKGTRGPVWKVGGSGTGKKLSTKHDISLTESGHFLSRLFRRVLRLWSVGKEISFFLRGEGNVGEHARALAHTVLLVRLLFAAALEKDVSSISHFAKQQSKSEKIFVLLLNAQNSLQSRSD